MADHVCAGILQVRSVRHLQGREPGADKIHNETGPPTHHHSILRRVVAVLRYFQNHILLQVSSSNSHYELLCVGVTALKHYFSAAFAFTTVQRSVLTSADLRIAVWRGMVCGLI